MPTNDKPVLLYVTAPSLADAERMGTEIVEQGLAACANILPAMVSIYLWQGERRRDEEVVLLLKTTQVRAADATSAVKALHPYEIPAILELPIDGGYQPFLDWIAGEVRGRA